MFYFPETVEEMFAGCEVRAAVGVWFDFAM
jgi:hypothetical protein